MTAWLVLAALAVIAVGCTQLPHVWREVPPEPELELGWWLPDTGLATPAAVETRVRERNVRQWLDIVLGTSREADEVPRVAPRRYATGVDPGVHSDVVCLVSCDGNVMRVESIEEVPHELDVEGMALREEAVRRFREEMYLPPELIDPDYRTPEQRRIDKIMGWIAARS